MQIAERHAIDEVIETGLLCRPVVAPVAVPLVDDVVMLGVEPAGNLRVTPKCIDRAVVVPAPIDVARAPLIAPHIPELGVEHRLMTLTPTRLEVPRRTWERAVAERLVVMFPLPPRQVLVPGVEIRLRMTDVTTDGIVFDESGRVERFREMIHAHDFALCFGRVAFALADFRR